MKHLFRLLITFVSGVSALYFVFWVGGAILLALHLPLWLSTVMSLAAAVQSADMFGYTRRHLSLG